MSENRDREHLRLLSIFHYVLAGVVVLTSLLPLIHLAIGVAMLAGAFDDGDDELALVGVAFVFLALCFMACGACLAALLVLAGASLRAERRFWLCMVVAALACLFTPLGTVLGVFTIVVLNRESVREIFRAHDRPARFGAG